MSKRKYEEYIENDCHPVGYNEPCQSYYFGQASVDLLLDKIDQLKQQLESREDSDSSTMKYLNKLRDENIKLKKELSRYKSYKTDDERIKDLTNLYSQYAEESKKLQQQLAEKDKEIELLKHLGNHETATEMFKENAKLIIEKNQLAIQELEKVKKTLTAYVRADHIIWDFNVNAVIDQQIKELKGEKDVED